VDVAALEEQGPQHQSFEGPQHQSFGGPLGGITRRDHRSRSSLTTPPQLFLSLPFFSHTCGRTQVKAPGPPPITFLSSNRPAFSPLRAKWCMSCMTRRHFDAFSASATPFAPRQMPYRAWPSGGCLMPPSALTPRQCLKNIAPEDADWLDLHDAGTPTAEQHGKALDEAARSVLSSVVERSSLAEGYLDNVVLLSDNDRPRSKNQAARAPPLE
jgi:hypothetical protein